MELNLTHHPICINETVYDGVLEQSVELDYMLPDYYPGIFKVLKCKMTPKLHAQRVNGNKLILEGVALAHLLYLSEGDNTLHMLTQKLPFSKTTELKVSCENPILSVRSKPGFVNCRVVNPRRLDLRGAVSYDVQVLEQRDEDVISDAEGNGVQLRKRSFSVCGKRKTASKQFTLREELAVAADKPAPETILSARSAVSIGDFKIIANKVVLKGELILHTLYADADGVPHQMEHSVPVSQIIDMPGVDEEDTCVIRTDVIAAELEPMQTDTGSILNMEMTVCAECEAFRNETVQLADDAYSTSFETESVMKTMKAEHLIACINQTGLVQSSIALSEGEAEEIYDILCDAVSVNPRFTDGYLMLCGDISAFILIRNNEGMPQVVERTFPFEIRTEYQEEDAGNMIADVCAAVLSSQYTLSGGRVDIKAEIKLSGSIRSTLRLNAVTDLTLDTQRPKERAHAAITIYFADKGEAVWEIAKRYGTAVSAILEENSLDSEILPERAMLLVPLTD